MKKIFAALLGLAVLVSNASGQVAQPNGAIMPTLPKGKESDVKFYSADGSAVTGRDAFERMSKASLVLWLAGNQFFAMDDVVQAFQKNHPGTTVGLITLPPGLLLQAIKTGGWIYGDTAYRGLPDV
jgi:ABC-type glycerol-3-phosphate transport system substrate-binding protein